MSEIINIKLPDGSILEMSKGISPKDVARKISERLSQETIGARINDVLVDYNKEINYDCSIKIVTSKDKDGLEILRHTTAHLLAHALTNLYPGIKLTIGPVVEEGFYYDIDSNKNFSPDDFKQIEDEMLKLANLNLEIKREEISKKDALELFKDNEYKLELINELSDETLSIYRQGDFFDLCRGPHLPNTGKIKAFKLTKVAGAYWRAKSTNRQLQRIYGISFFDKKELSEYLKFLEEAERKNHRRIGEDLELFAIFDLIGKGLPVWLPKGEIIRSEIEKFAIETENKYGYVRVSTPHIAKKELFLKSGHLPHYEDSMYPCMHMDDGDYYLKAMNCPLHHLVYSKKPKSYRELPLRIAEYGTVYRNELSGALSGLLRVRILRMNDAHIYCTKDQIEQEMESSLNMIKFYYDIFGIKNYSFRLSLHDENNKDKYINEPENWKYCEDIVRSVLKRLNVPFVEAKDEAAFYGPKIDIQLKNVYGREETMSTVQLDFSAKKRFDLNYTDSTGNKNNEVFVIHRAPLSTHERFMAFLIELYEGKFPLWLSPIQVKILTVADRHSDFAKLVYNMMISEGIRVETDDRAESISYKVRDAQLKQVNYIIVVGDKEIENHTVTVRTRDNQILGAKKVEEFINTIKDEIKTKK